MTLPILDGALVRACDLCAMPFADGDPAVLLCPACVADQSVPFDRFCVQCGVAFFPTDAALDSACSSCRAATSGREELLAIR